jgi:hypothetical protein
MSCTQEKSSSTWTRRSHYEIHRSNFRTSRFATVPQQLSSCTRDDSVAYTSLSMHVRERHFLLCSTDCGESWGACTKFAGIVNSLLHPSFGIAPAQTIGLEHKLLDLSIMATDYLGGSCLFTAEKYINPSWLLFSLSIDQQTHCSGKPFLHLENFWSVYSCQSILIQTGGSPDVENVSSIYD